MTAHTLNGAQVSTFCGNIAMMLSAGIPSEEAISLLEDTVDDSLIHEACTCMYRKLTQGTPFAEAMEATDQFPRFAVEMTHMGERSGHLDTTMASLSRYYDEEHHLLMRLHSTIRYPVIIFAIISVLLLFIVSVILPIFARAYQTITGGLASGPQMFATGSFAIGWIAFVISILCLIGTTIVAVMSSPNRSFSSIERIFSHVPFARESVYSMAVCRFMSAFSSLITIGEPIDRTIAQATELVHYAPLRKRLNTVVAHMQDPAHTNDIGKLLADNGICDPMHARMLTTGSKTGQLDEVVSYVNTVFFDAALTRMDTTIDTVKPLLAIFLTVTIGITLLSIMLPLIGILGSI
ncbi:MAG: type II secretion system F family protein [Eggerthellaceae bacterium]|jgi:type IV pilus assembly protein PilC|nr:type II secretion system F family protein [Eggerthellaceae bacterium]MCH4221014.1 type II secretion system F family protein [Eggerthellaceae bacterium]